MPSSYIPKLLGILLLCLTCRLHAQVADTTFDRYKKLNDAETRLEDYKDNDDALRLKLIQLQVINKSRKQHRAQAVQLDILASRVANKMCREATDNNYLGHWNMAGEKPYHRYAFAGGMDHVAENASAKWIEGSSFDTGEDNILKFMKELHLAFMAEKAPHDGHKQNCIQKSHNYVGIGYCMALTRFSYYEEFVDRYLTFEDVPETAPINTKITIRATVPDNLYIVYSVAYYETALKPMKPKQIERLTSYPDFSKKRTNELMPWELKAQRTGNTYEIPFLFKKKGLYYIHLYVQDKEPKGKKQFDSRKLYPASGIVIHAE
ncbi:MAG: hypothetical protein JST26_19930 [Bacteroidetes bacterium]|nr:hypothetical protein [Bacteroidota bacterium]